jgi:hypothetical protein
MISVLVGWFAGAMLTFYAVPHPLMHSEWMKQPWRGAAARRSLSIAPVTYFGPPLLAAVIAAIRHRRGWDSSGLLHQMHGFYRKAWLPLLLLLLGVHAALGVVIAYFLHVAGRV